MLVLILVTASVIYEKFDAVAIPCGVWFFQICERAWYLFVLGKPLYCVINGVYLNLFNWKA